MPGKSRIPVGAKEGDGSEFIFSENPQEKGMLYEGWCMFETKEGEILPTEMGVRCVNVHEITMRILIRPGFGRSFQTSVHRREGSGKAVTSRSGESRDAGGRVVERTYPGVSAVFSESETDAWR